MPDSSGGHRGVKSPLVWENETSGREQFLKGRQCLHHWFRDGDRPRPLPFGELGCAVGVLPVVLHRDDVIFKVNACPLKTSYLS